MDGRWQKTWTAVSRRLDVASEKHEHRLVEDIDDGMWMAAGRRLDDGWWTWWL